MKKNIHINSNAVNTLFSQISLSLIFLVLTTLYLPYVLTYVFDDIFILKTFDNISLIGIENIRMIVKFIILVVSNFLCYYIIKTIGCLKFKDYFKTTNISFIEIFYYTCLLISGISIIIFLIQYLSIYFPSYVDVYVGIIYPIGLFFKNIDFNNYLFLFLFIIVGPFFDELIFRGVLLRFLSRFGYKFALITTTFIYTLFQQNISAILMAIFISYILSKLTLRYRSVQVAIVIHILLNAFFALFILVPKRFYFIVVLIIILVYILSIFGLVNGKIRIIKFRKNVVTNELLKMFFLKISALFLILLSLFYPIFTFIFRI